MRSLSRSGFAFVLLTLLLAACSQPGPKTKDIVSANGKFRLTVPGGWDVEKDLNDAADLQASYRGSDMYIVVLSESKEDLHDMNLEGHSKLTRDALMKTVQDSTITGPAALTVDGHPAVQYEIRGAVNHVNVVYLHTTVESPKYFHQILAWTIPSRFDANKPTLEQV
ncbi:MAG: hypothetical protein K8R69_06310, partial [Deltaproteobacteria bacterium]|nr:hypothetical protein [Deltaproteobacteria bacterium]